MERRTCERALTELGIENIKIKGVTGYPDRMFLIPGGRPLLIEFKRPGEKPRPSQLLIHSHLRALGYDLEVHDEEVRAFTAIAAALQAAQVSGRSRQVPAGTD